MRLIFILTLTVIIFLSSCKNKGIAFDKSGWNKPCDGIPCPVQRDKMIDDLLTHHKLIGLSYRQIVSKIGNADNNEQTPSGIIRYEITTEYTSGDIVHIKALDFYYNRDSIITYWKLVSYDVDM